MSTAFLTPVCDSAAVELSRTLFKKQVLPKRSINYKGRTITFDDAYLTDLAAAYNATAFDQVPFMLADKDNQHTMDPERFRGEVKGLNVEEDGLYAYLELSAGAQEMIRQNPKLGVSARIIEGLDHADGRHFDRAVQHVLGTLDPRVTGLKPWEEVSLSTQVDETVDLTNETYEQEGLVMADDQDIVDEDLDESGAFDDALLVDFSDADNHEEEETEVPNTEDIELVRAESYESQLRITQLESELALSRFEKEQDGWLNAGVPPKMIELAKPVLSMPHPPIIDLARGEGDDRYVDLSKVVRDILEEAKGTIDLGREDGDAEGDTDNDAKLLEAWANQS